MTQRPPFDRDVNTVFQDYALFPHLTVAQNVEYGLLVRRSARPSAAAGRGGAGAHAARRFRRPQAEPALRRPAPARRPGQSADQPAQGLLLDEPLGALDLKLREQMQVELKALQRQVGITFVFVTHDQGEALTMSDRIAVFNAGRIEQVATPAEVYERPATEFVAGFVGTSNLLRGEAARALLGRDGVGIRPEKIRLAGVDSAVADGEGSALGSWMTSSTSATPPGSWSASTRAACSSWCSRT